MNYILTIALVWLGLISAYSQNNTTIAVTVQNHSNKVLMEKIAAFVEESVSEIPNVCIVSRTHLRNVIEEQQLNKENVVYNKNSLKIGQLQTAQLIFIVTIVDDYSKELVEKINVDGLIQTRTNVICDISYTIRIVEVETGKQLGQCFVTGRDLPFNKIAKVWLNTIQTATKSALLNKTNKTALSYCKLFISPSTPNNESFDVFVDGNYVGQTPLVFQVESGVREICLKLKQNISWKTTLKVDKDEWITPQLNRS
jgi:hypothetical protein